MNEHERTKDDGETPTGVWIAGAALGFCRLTAALVAVAAPGQTGWQTAMLPILVADLPVSLVYFFALPPPVGEVLVGPIWWALLPWLVWKVLRRVRRSRTPDLRRADGE